MYRTNFADKVLKFTNDLSSVSIDLPDKFKLINPYSGKQQAAVCKITTAFYQKYFDDTKPRRLILGSSPARRGTAMTGVPFEDAKHLQTETGILIDQFYINQSSSNFLYDVMTKYGGSKKFYNAFYLGFVWPLGLASINAKGNEVNCNYYENKKVQNLLLPFIVHSLRRQIDFGIDTSVCYCIGSGENYKVLVNINHQYHFFETIVPLEHPRFITQYHPKDHDKYLEKYLNALHHESC